MIKAAKISTDLFILNYHLKYQARATPSGLAYSIIKNFVQLSTANSTFLVSLLVCLVICPTRIAAAMVPSRTPLRWPRNTSDSTTALQDDFSQEKKVQNQIYLNIEQDRLHNVSGLC